MLFPPPGEAKILTVSALTAEVKTLLEEGFDSVWVTGEISTVSRPASGHLYLTLKDEKAVLPCVIWRSTLARLRFEPKEGLSVIVHGKFTVFPPHGKYQLDIDKLEPKGIGAQELALRQLREKLFGLGYFDPKRKKELPTMPRRLAIVTSPTGAAVRDILEILARRWPAVEVFICPVRVQGETAALEIANALKLLNRLNHVDVIIVGRGGGSSEDLSAFNQEIVARALFESRIPVVSAVGHEIDVTIADLVADVRALTPSEAAERVVPDRQELLGQLQRSETYLRDLLHGRLRQANDRLEAFRTSRAFRLPLERVRDHEQALDDWKGRLDRAVKIGLTGKRQALEAAAGRLDTLSPLNVLKRGYSLTRKENEKQVVDDARAVQPGDRLETLVAIGRIISRVERTEVEGVSA